MTPDKRAIDFMQRGVSVRDIVRILCAETARYEREAKAWRALHESDYGEDWNSCWNEVSASRAVNEEAERADSR